MKYSLPAFLLLTGLTMGYAQEGHSVSADIEIQGRPASKDAGASSKVVVWLTPLGERRAAPRDPGHPPTLLQKNKSFSPHLLVVPVGSVVEFPNRDPFFHNVFSLFDGKRFDLGLYEAGSTRLVHFDKPGISYIFCNIHPEMSAAVVALDTPYYAMANKSGRIMIPGVPTGRYRLHVWDERAMPQALSELSREVLVSEDRALGTIRVTETDSLMAHKNKYGRDYDKAAPSSPAYPEQ
jgi:hypothetical protein